MSINLILDNTMLQCFDRCPCNFQWRHVQHLVPQAQNQLPLLFGTAIHSALEALYLGKSAVDILAAFDAVWGQEPGDDKRSKVAGHLILEAYIKKWWPEAFQLQQVETNFQFELTKDIVFCGKLDGIVTWLGEVYILEHKTTSSFSWFTPKPNHQLSGYIYGTKVLGFPAVGAIVNLIAVLKTKQDFHRVITTRQPWELQLWYKWVLSTKADIERAVNENWFPQRTHSCYFCPYKDLCNSPADTLQVVIGSKYKTKLWQPWKEEENGN